MHPTERGLAAWGKLPHHMSSGVSLSVELMKPEKVARFHHCGSDLSVVSCITDRFAEMHLSSNRLGLYPKCLKNESGFICRAIYISNQNSLCDSSTVR